MLQVWPLVGRGTEIRLIAEAMERGDARGAVVAGDPGFGRSRLTAEVARGARERGWEVVEVGATAAARAVPLGALAPMLSQRIVNTRDSLGRLLEACRSIDAWPAPGRRLLCVDDAHLLDALSATVLYNLSRARSAFILVTLQTGAAAPDAITALWKDELSVRVDLDALAVSDLRALLEAALPGAIDKATLFRLGERTAGNLVFLRALVSDGMSRGTLTDRGGRWSWRGPMAPPARIAGLIGQQLRALPPVVLQIAEVVAAAEPVDASLVEAVVTRHAHRWLNTSDLLTAEPTDGRVLLRIRQPIVGDVLRAGTPPLRARAIKRRLAQAMARTGTVTASDAVRLAEWRLDAGETLPPEAALHAARGALSEGRFSSARRLAACAGVNSEATLVIGLALGGEGRFAESEAALAQAGMGSAVPDSADEIAAARAATVFWALHQPHWADALLPTASTSPATPSGGHLARVTRAHFDFSLGHINDAIAAATALIDDPSAPPRAVSRAHAVRGAALAISGRTEDALADASRGSAVLAGSGERDRHSEEMLRSARWDALWFAGRLGEAESLAGEAYRQSLADGDEGSTAWSAFQLGLVARARGRVNAALDWLGEAVMLLDRYHPAMVSAALAAQAQAAALTGDPAHAAHAAGLLADRRLLDRPRFPSDEVRVALARAWTQAAAGDPAQASASAAMAVDIAERSGLWALAAIALHDAARLGEAPYATARFSVLMSRCPVDGALVPLLASHAAATASGDGRALDEVSDRLEDLGLLLSAAESAACASRAHLRARRPARARTASHRALDLLQRCDGAGTPALRGLRPPAVLTTRQHEIAALAADGLSSFEIASRLSLSVRTVDNHLQRAYAKLEVPGRRLLRDALSAAEPRSNA